MFCVFLSNELLKSSLSPIWSRPGSIFGGFEAILGGNIGYLWRVPPHMHAKKKVSFSSMFWSPPGLILRVFMGRGGVLKGFGSQGFFFQYSCLLSLPLLPSSPHQSMFDPSLRMGRFLFTSHNCRNAPTNCGTALLPSFPACSLSLSKRHGQSSNCLILPFNHYKS